MPTVNKASQARGWDLPPDELRAVVNARFGTDWYRRIQTAWEKGYAQLPGAAPAYTKEQQLRKGMPEELVGAEGKPNPLSCHYLGLCRDVGWAAWPEAQKRSMVDYLKKEGFAVEMATGNKIMRRHLHYGIPNADLQRPDIQRILRGTVSLLQRLREVGVSVANR